MKFVGGREFARAVQSLSKQKKQRVSQEVTNTAARIEAQAKASAPVDTGYMRQDIAFQKVNDMTARVDSRAPYSVYVDKGTRKQGAQPFFTPAIENGEKTFYKNVKGIIDS